MASVVQAAVETIVIHGTDYIEFYVGNAKQAAYFYQKAFGFNLVAYAGPETGVRDRASYVLQQNKIRFVLSTALTPDHPISEHVKQHGDGVKDVALWVEDAKLAHDLAVSRGGTSVMAPVERSDEHGKVVLAAVATYGDTIHTFVERKAYNGVFLPGFVSAKGLDMPTAGLEYIDHVVGNVGWNEMNSWVDFYRQIFGFHQFANFDDKDISTEYSALRSVVVANDNERIKFPLNEPAEGKKKSQIEEYIQFYGAPGVQHLALITHDIVATVKQLRANGVEFLSTPDSYYEDLLTRVGTLQEDLNVLKEHGILVDVDDKGYMLQIFTKPLEDRPTVFFEIIQRRGSESFGKGNFKALFESIEREQDRRGNL
ncbi:MAG TPA: 4-hydroxyphenylpyruvate dioxygenase [Stenomitos sp.]